MIDFSKTRTHELREFAATLAERAEHEQMAAEVLAELERNPNIRNSAMIYEIQNRALVSKAFRAMATEASEALARRMRHA